MLRTASRPPLSQRRLELLLARAQPAVSRAESELFEGGHQICAAKNKQRICNMKYCILPVGAPAAERGGTPPAARRP